MSQLGLLKESVVNAQEGILTHRELQNLTLRSLYHQYDMVVLEFTPYKSGLSFDAIAFKRYKPEIRVIECKANRADFLADKKWEKYLPYCTHLAFLGSKEVFSKDELPGKIGVIRPRWKTLRNGTQKLEWYYERGCKRLHDLDKDHYIAVLEGMLWQYMQCLWRCPEHRKRYLGCR